MQDNSRLNQLATSQLQRRPRAWIGNWFAFVLMLGVGSCLVSGCAKAKAATVPDGPPLAVPAPPSRVLAPVEEVPVAEIEPEPEPAATPAPANPGRRPTTPRRTPPTATTPTDEPKPETPAGPPAVTEAPTTPRPAPTQADAAAERKVRDLINRQKADIGRVDYQKLTANGKLQYETSKRLNEQAEQELKERNYAYATTLADKAAQIAEQLLAAR
jgi:hypothetical protein